MMDRSKLNNKRKLPYAGIQRRVRARKEEEPEPNSEVDFSDESQGEGPGEDDDALEGGSSEEGSSDDDEVDEPEASSASDEDEDAEVDNPSLAASQVTFGALAKAAATLPGARQKKNKKKGRRGQDDSDSVDDNEAEEEAAKYATKTNPKATQPKIAGRTNKHAPAEQSSKRAVTRKREVVSVPKVASRDPRFSAASGPVDEERARRAYSFLDEYRDAEMAQLREAVRKTRDLDAKEELKRALLSMQSRKKSQAAKDAEKAVVAEHRRKEKELVKQGKTPFYLKKSEQKKRMLMDRFAGMKKGQVDRAIERRRKKMVSKERKDMPYARREVG